MSQFHTIDGETQLVGLIGWPVAHSLSPLMHNAAFRAAGLNWRYLPLPVPPGQVTAAVRGLGALGFRGANVTLPHKESVVAVLDSVAPTAQDLGAVNTLVVGRREGRAIVGGYNTDVQGFLSALRTGGFEPMGQRAVVVGAGGAARAVVFGLLSAGASSVTLFNRTFSRARALVNEIGKRPQDAARLRAAPLVTETLVDVCRDADLLVNATSVGMAPQDEESIWPNAVPVPDHLTVFDLVYTPLETKLLYQARVGGARTIDGLGMLVRQGALAFNMWITESYDTDDVARVMRIVCERVLKPEGGADEIPDLR